MKNKRIETEFLSVYCLRRDSGMAPNKAFDVTVKYTESSFFQYMNEILNQAPKLDINKKLQTIKDLFQDYQFVKSNPYQIFEHAYEQRNELLDLSNQ